MKRISLLTVSFIFVLLSISFIVSDYFTGEGIDESVIYHLFYGLGGAGLGDYIAIILTSAFLFVIGMSVLYGIQKVAKRASNRLKLKSVIAYPVILLSFFVHPASIDLYNLSFTKTYTDFLKYYKKPRIDAKPDARRNVVYIYAEGLERTYFDETIFPGLIKGLRNLESRSTYFTDIEEVWGTGWTIGGMVASQCGIPLYTPSHGNSMSGMDSFLKNAVCLGDLLKNEGYRLSYYGGASLDFAGKGKFYSTHSFDDIRGYDELIQMLPDKSYKTSWGLYDDSLFDIAYGRFEKLSERGEPFGLFLLTLDTHHPYGSPSRSCNGLLYKDGSNPMLNAVACSDYLIYNFVNKIIASKYGKNSVIVIASDHLSMKNSAYYLLKRADRKNLLMVIDPDKNEPRKIEKKGSTLDVGPTLLAVLGYKGSIGLGRNLFGDDNSIVLEFEDVDKKLSGWKESLREFWSFPRIRKAVKIDSIMETITIDDRSFGLPAIVEFNDKLETEFKFQFHNSPSHKKLGNHFYEMDKNTSFLWVDNCATLMIVDHKLNGPGICVIAGKKGLGLAISSKVNGTAIISAKELREIALSEINVIISDKR